MHVSWITIVILVSSMIVPTPPRKMLVGVAGRGVDGSARRLDRAPARPAGAVGRRTPSSCSCRTTSCAVVAIAAVARAAAARPAAARGAGAGQLSAGRAARPRRHGRGLAGRAPAAGAQRGGQAGAARSCSAPAARPKRKLMLRRFEREAQATAALSSPHTIQRVRLRRHRRRDVLLRDGAAGRPRPRVAGARVRPAAGRPRHLPAAAGLPLAGRRARPRPGAPRHQAGQHLRLPDGARLRLRQGARLRPGQVQATRRRRSRR